MGKSLIDNVGGKSEKNCRLGPYDVSPIVGIREGDLVVSEYGEVKVEVVKRDWDVGETFRYFFCRGDRPKSTKEIAGVGELVEVERITGVSGFGIVEENGRYFVNYTRRAD